MNAHPLVKPLTAADRVEMGAAEALAYRLNGANRTAVPAPARIDRAEAIKRARTALAPSLKGRQAPAYPMRALGPLAAVCNGIAEAAQVQPAMVGQCLLGAASLLTQGLYNVETLAGPRPLSLYLLTLGDSGDGKSTAQDVALHPVNEWQRAQAKVYADDLNAFECARATRKRGDDPPPEAPVAPFRLVGDATVEGLRRDLNGGVCSQGVFTDEAAAILSGYGMSHEQRAKTASVFSRLWDAGHLSVSRATGGRVERYGRRVAMHWLIQPMAAAEALGDPLLSALGFWPRFLAAWPAPQEPRVMKPFKPNELESVTAYWIRCKELLAMGLGDDADQCLMLKLADDARQHLGRAFEKFEVEARRGGLQMVKPFALRACEQACRIAGVLVAFDRRDMVSLRDIQCALALTGYNVMTWRAIIDEGAADQCGAHAMRLYEYLTTRPDWRESLAVIVNAGPACVRSRDSRNAALSVLKAAGLVIVDAGRAYALAGKEA
jgi:hypothetical protein